MFGRKRKEEKSAISKKQQMVSLLLPEGMGFPLPRVYISEEDLHRASICLRSLSRNGILGPTESAKLRQLFGKSIARGEAGELADWIEAELKTRK